MFTQNVLNVKEIIDCFVVLIKGVHLTNIEEKNNNCSIDSRFFFYEERYIYR